MYCDANMVQDIGADINIILVGQLENTKYPLW